MRVEQDISDVAPPGQEPPIVPPFDYGSSSWRFWDFQFNPGIDYYPTGHLLGKTSLGYEIEVAAVKDELGLGMTAADEEALRIEHEYSFHDSFDGYGDEQWAA